jgi:hypothetical protein
MTTGSSSNKERWGGRMTTNDGDTRGTPNGRHTTHPQPCKQLLVGWITGGMTMLMTQDDDDDDDKGSRTMTMTMRAG